jgi:hypothetical protein
MDRTLGRQCTICNHPQRVEIDKALVDGVAYRRIAAEYGVSDGSLRRHKKNGHIAEQIAKAARKKEIKRAGEIASVVEEKERREVADADRLLRVVEGLLAECLRMVKDAQVGDEGTKLRAVREARETAKLLLEVQGELAANPVINITLIETQLNDIRALVLGDLCPVCQAVVAERLKARKQQREIPCQ